MSGDFDFFNALWASIARDVAIHELVQQAGALGGAALLWLFWFLRPFLSRFLLLTSDQTDVQWVAAPVDYVDWIVIGFADFANAFAEEFAMRGLLLTLLIRLWNSRLWAVIVSSACFASYHIYYGLYGMQWIFIMGLFFGISFVVMRRLWPIILCHFAFNLLPLASSLNGVH